MKISAIIIAKNEENTIADCIDSVLFCDEIIVIDNNSTDRTIEVAKRMGGKVFTAQGDDFSQLRNFGKEKATGDWIFYIDADERVTEELRSSIKKLLDKEYVYSAYRIKRKNFYFGSIEWPYIERMERLFRKESLRGWRGKLHETPIVEGKIGNLSGYLLHYTHRDLTSMLEKTIAWSDFEAFLRFQSRHPKMTWWRFFRVMLTSFLDSYIRKKGYKAGTAGMVESIYQSYSMFVTYAKLWEMQMSKKSKE